MKLIAKDRKSVDNTRGKIFYGVHMYPGISENLTSEGDTERLYVSDQTIRKMTPTMQGCPVFTTHKKPTGTVDEVHKESEGSVVESFFNEADGQHWCKFIASTSKAISQCESGRYGLSNGYDIIAETGRGGQRNGVSYDSEVTEGEFHHLAIVANPRYESKILTPEEFKQYNTGKRDETRRVANSKDGYKGIIMSKAKSSGISIFTRKKVDNSRDLEKLSVLLPKSGKEHTIADLVKIADKAVMNAGKARVCNADDVVQVEEDGEAKDMTIGELVEMLGELKERVEALEAGEDDEDEDMDDLEEDDEIENSDDMDDDDDSDVDNEDDDDDSDVDNEDDEETPREKFKAKAKAKVKTKEKEVVKNKKKGVKNSGHVFQIGKTKKEVSNADKRAKVKADKAREAPRRVSNAGQAFAVDTTEVKLNRGMDRYGKV